MTRLFKYIVLAASAVIAAGACSDMNSLHEPYLERGETVYAAKADSVKAYIGVNKQVIEVFIPNQRAVKGVISWNLGENSREFEIPEPRPKSVRVEIDDLSEGSYTYEIRMFDAFGNQSVPLEVTSNVLSPASMESHRQMFEHSAFYEVYPVILDYFKEVTSDYKEEVITSGQVWEGDPAFKWTVGGLPAGGTIYVRYRTTSGVEKTKTYTTKSIKVGYCYDLSDADVEDPAMYPFHYYTEYLGIPYDPSRASVKIDKDIDLGEDYVDRYYHYEKTITFNDLAASIENCSVVCHPETSKIDITYNEREEDWVL